MNYETASELSKGQKYAMAMPLVELPTRKPVPDQESLISCMAEIVPIIDKSWVHYLGSNKVEVFLSYIASGEAVCIMNPPACKNCKIYEIAQSLKSGLVTLTEEDFNSGNLAAFKPEI